MMTDYPQHFIHLELSTKCALQCPRCPRTEMEGMYKIGELSLDFIKNTFDQISNEIKQIHICGGQGDPIYNNHFLEIIRYLKSLPSSPHLKIITNGSYKSEEWWTELASILTPIDYIVFSIDGWDNKSNNLYRVGSDFDSIIKGLKIMVASPAIVRWSTIIFKFNENKIEDIIELARSLGVDRFDITKSTLFGSKFYGYRDKELGYDPLEPSPENVSTYGGRWGKYTINFFETDIHEKYFVSKEKFNKRREKYLDKYVIPICKCSGLLYIDVEGMLYPCSWVSHPFHIKRGTYSRRRLLWKDNFWSKHKDEINLHKHTIEEVFNSKAWNILESTWDVPEKCFLECENKCLTDNVDYQKIIKKRWGVSY
ncbi:MAG: radical SAM protein [Candidatus Heimdallarchaeaceae archaeon]